MISKHSKYLKIVHIKYLFIFFSGFWLDGFNILLSCSLDFQELATQESKKKMLKHKRRHNSGHSVSSNRYLQSFSWHQHNINNNNNIVQNIYAIGTVMKRVRFVHFTDIFREKCIKNCRQLHENYVYWQ